MDTFTFIGFSIVVMPYVVEQIKKKTPWSGSEIAQAYALIVALIYITVEATSPSFLMKAEGFLSQVWEVASTIAITAGFTFFGGTTLYNNQKKQ